MKLLTATLVRRAIHHNITEECCLQYSGHYLVIFYHSRGSITQSDKCISIRALIQQMYDYSTATAANQKTPHYVAWLLNMISALLHIAFLHIAS